MFSEGLGRFLKVTLQAHVSGNVDGGKGPVSADLGVRVVGGLWLESEYCDLLWLSFLSRTQD